LHVGPRPRYDHADPSGDEKTFLSFYTGTAAPQCLIGEVLSDPFSRWRTGALLARPARVQGGQHEQFEIPIRTETSPALTEFRSLSKLPENSRRCLKRELIAMNRQLNLSLLWWLILLTALVGSLRPLTPVIWDDTPAFVDSAFQTLETWRPSAVGGRDPGYPA